MYQIGSGFVANFDSNFWKSPIFRVFECQDYGSGILDIDHLPASDYKIQILSLDFSLELQVYISSCPWLSQSCVQPSLSKPCSWCSTPPPALLTVSRSAKDSSMFFSGPLSHTLPVIHHLDYSQSFLATIISHMGYYDSLQLSPGLL